MNHQPPLALPGCRLDLHLHPDLPGNRPLQTGEVRRGRRWFARGSGPLRRVVLEHALGIANGKLLSDHDLRQPLLLEDIRNARENFRMAAAELAVADQLADWLGKIEQPEEVCDAAAI